MEIPDEVEETKFTLPVCDWVYFATTAKECWTVTKEFVSEAKIIFAHAYNKLGIRMPNVQHLEPGDKILLVHGGGGKPYRALFCCTIGAAARPVRNQDLRHTFSVFSYADESLYERRYATGYEPDPVLKNFTGITLAALDDVHHTTCSIEKPLGNNTLRRWDEVFPSNRNTGESA